MFAVGRSASCRRPVLSSASRSACATRPAMSAWTSKTSVSAASKGCCQRARGRSRLADLHQLGTHLHSARGAALGPAHRAGQQVPHAQLAGDDFRRLAGLAVGHRARPRDHLDTGQRGELPAHRVGDPVGEVRIRRVAEILERQHGETWDRGGRSLARPPDRPSPPPAPPRRRPPRRARAATWAARRRPASPATRPRTAARCSTGPPAPWRAPS